MNSLQRAHQKDGKKIVDYLYINADEDHVALQFCEKKGDVVKAEDGVKNNGLLAKLVYIYEGRKKKASKADVGF